MVTLAFAQAGAILVQKNPHSWTGGEQGLGYDYTRCRRRSSASSTRRTSTGSRWATRVVGVPDRRAGPCDSSPGHVFQAIRENERRVEVLGLRTRGYKLLSFVLGSMLATAGGVVYLLLVGGADPA